MTAIRATSAEGLTLFASLQVLRVEARYRALMANEKVVARQEFLAGYDRGAARVRTDSYALSGLAADGDLLIVRSSNHLEDLNAAATLVSDAGLGRHLTPSALYLGTLGDAARVSGRFLCVVPLSEKPAAAAPAGARLSVLDCRGLGPAPFVALLEGDDVLMGRAFLAAVGASSAPVRMGLHGEIRDIVDSL
ncbi:MAG: hypothetical protein HYZ75_12430 [Elusimicrobia bacterium]|nr:hypothetical protein [Elusimicrobiota bacterium]